jgi:hypothetical protein
MPPANAGPTNAPVNLLRSVWQPDAPLDRIFVREPNAVVPVMLDQVERRAYARNVTPVGDRALHI